MALKLAELESKLTALEKQIETYQRAVQALESEREQLRDRLAMAALARIGLGGARWVAVQAYEIADAMLDIRKALLPCTTDDGGHE